MEPLVFPFSKLVNSTVCVRKATRPKSFDKLGREGEAPLTDSSPSASATVH